MCEFEKWILKVSNCEVLPENDLKKLCNVVKDILVEENNLQPVQTPVNICGSKNL